jgi:ABC-type oligopeptide transport system substrate-binding subunit
MKKILALFLVSTFLFACTNSTTTEKKNETTKKDSTAKDTSNPNAPGATNAQY